MTRKKTVTQIKAEVAEALADRYFDELRSALHSRGVRPEDANRWLIRWESMWFDAAYDGVPVDEMARRIIAAGDGPWR